VRRPRSLIDGVLLALMAKSVASELTYYLATLNIGFNQVWV